MFTYHRLHRGIIKSWIDMAKSPERLGTFAADVLEATVTMGSCTDNLCSNTSCNRTLLSRLVNHGHSLLLLAVLSMTRLKQKTLCRGTPVKHRDWDPLSFCSLHL